MSDFIFIQPKKNPRARAISVVRIRFSKSKKNPDSYILTIYLGKDLAEKIKLPASNKVAIGYDKNNPRRLVLRKSDIGYAATKINGKDTPALRIMLQWQIFTPTESDFLLKEVKHEISNSDLIIFC